MDVKRLFASDLDGTLIPSDHERISTDGYQQGVAEFTREVQSVRLLSIAYVTGRHFDYAIEGVNQAGLPTPNYFLTDVGTTLYVREGEHWKLEQGYAAQLDEQWDSELVDTLTAELLSAAGVRLQEEEKQGRYKRSFYLESSVSRKEIQKRLSNRVGHEHRGVQMILSSAVDSSFHLLDLLPRGASKLSGVEYLQSLLDVPEINTVFAGDSGNDLEVFFSGIQSIIVANRRQEVAREIEKALKGGELSSESIYQAERECIDGVLDGLRHFSFFPAQ